MTLPVIFARLSDPTASTVAFTAVQSHQAHAWHAFLVQIAAMVCQRAGIGITNADCRRADWWKARLLALVDDCTEAWCLVVEDVRKPAFMQVPVPDGSLNDYMKDEKTSALEYDALSLAKNHEAKMARHTRQPEQWMFSLICFQTMNGYTKAGPNGGYYSPFRQNGSTGNRFAVGYADPSDLGSWFRRDCGALITNRVTTIQHHGFASEGIALLWMVPWDGKKTSCLPHSSLDPWCVEVCRRIRLIAIQDQPWSARVAASAAERTTIAKRAKGSGNEWIIKNGFGDPWMACDQQGQALTPGEQGFSIGKSVECMESNPGPPTQSFQPEDLGSDLHWYGRTLVRGQGKTNGWHERLVPIPAHVRRHWRDKPEARAIAAERARSQLEDSSELRSKVLRSALLTLISAGGRDAQRWLIDFEVAVDAAFFGHLWDHMDNEKDEARRSWRRLIIALARDTLATAQASMPDGVRRWRALADSQRRFDEGLKSKPSRSDSFDASLREFVPQEQA